MKTVTASLAFVLACVSGCNTEEQAVSPRSVETTVQASVTPEPEIESAPPQAKSKDQCDTGEETIAAMSDEDREFIAQIDARLGMDRKQGCKGLRADSTPREPASCEGVWVHAEQYRGEGDPDPVWIFAVKSDEADILLQGEQGEESSGRVTFDPDYPSSWVIETDDLRWLIECAGRKMIADPQHSGASTPLELERVRPEDFKAYMQRKGYS